MLGEIEGEYVLEEHCKINIKDIKSGMLIYALKIRHPIELIM